MSRHANPRPKSRWDLLIPALCAVLLLWIGGTFAWAAFSGDGERDVPSEAEAGCSGKPLQVAVAPRIADVVSKGLDSLASDCVDFDVHERTASEVASSVAYGGAQPPDLWVGDSPWAMVSLDEGGVALDTISPALASSPVLVVGSKGADRPASWGDLLTKTAVAMPDPMSDSVGALVLASVHAEDEQLGRAKGESAGLLVPTAQRYGELAANGLKTDLSLDSLQPGGDRLVVATEQELVHATSKELAEVTPSTGSALLEFPLVVPNTAPDEARAAAEDLAKWFDSGDGTDALSEAGLRPGDGAALPADAGVGKVSLLAIPDKSVVDSDLSLWKVMSVPSSILAVFDVSGSMDFDAPSGGTRIDLAVDVATTALDSFPDHARVGLWAFSIQQDGAKDYRVLEPLRRLDAQVRGRSQRERLAGRADELPTMTQGGTGLNDTALAAYEQALADYDQYYANAVILLTDGANDDPGSISENDLIKRLKKLRDPDRPVRIVAIGLTEDADMGALKRIAAATGGKAHLTNTPEDILRVFAQEIANR